MGPEALDFIVQGSLQRTKFEEAARSVCLPTSSSWTLSIQLHHPGARADSGHSYRCTGRITKAVPSWLLAVMVFSDLFKQYFIDQVQVVAYLSDYDTTRADMGEDFLLHRE